MLRKFRKTRRVQNYNCLVIEIQNSTLREETGTTRIRLFIYVYLPSTGKYRRVVIKKIVKMIRLSRLNKNAIAMYHDAPE